jgi:hypothetical protein
VSVLLGRAEGRKNKRLLLCFSSSAWACLGPRLRVISTRFDARDMNVTTAHLAAALCRRRHQTNMACA